MAITVVQRTPMTELSNSTTAGVVFPTPPVVGDGIVLFVNVWRNTGLPVPDGCTDNFGNTYVRVVQQSNAQAVTALFYCAAVTGTGANFTIAVTSTQPSYWVLNGLECSSGLAVDQFLGATGLSATPAVGPTAPLTGADVFQAACHAILASHTSITVATVVPPWVQEFEELSSSLVAGEADTRSTPSAAGTAPSCSWTATSAAGWAAVIVAFKAAAPPPPVTLLTPPTPFANARGQTDAAGALMVTPGTAGTLGPLTPLAQLPIRVDNTGAIAVASVVSTGLYTKRTALANLRGRVDANGALIVTPIGSSGSSTPLTPLANLQVRTDENGALLVADMTATGGVTALTPLGNLQGRTDVNGALLVSGLAAPPAVITQVASVTAGSTPTGATTAAIDTTRATLLTFSLSGLEGAVIATVSDSKGNTWVPLTRQLTTGVFYQLWYVVGSPIVGAGHTFSVTGSGLYAAMIVQAFSGVQSFDKSTGAANSAVTTVAVGPLTPAFAGSLILTGIVLRDELAAGYVPHVAPAMTETFKANVNSVNLPGATGYVVQTSPTAITATWTWSAADQVASTLAVFTPL